MSSLININNNFLDLPPELSTYGSSRVAVLPIPFEKSVSYGGGASKGPDAIIQASGQVEWYDEEINAEACQVGIATAAPVVCKNITGEEAVKEIAKRTSKLISDGKFPVGLGGEHTVTAGCVMGMLKECKDFGVLQLDAHADLRDSYQGDRYSHASVMRRVREFGLPIAAVGIRSLCQEEVEYIKREKIAVFYDRVVNKDGWPLEGVINALPKRVYITIDVDGFSPSVVPATGTPEPGGLPWYETLSFLKQIFAQKDVIGLDVVELAPIEGLHFADFSMAKLIYKLIGYRFIS
ncbi:MAG: agmatinase [Deltaproteobacteria bacterium RIFCSPHIGHO2_12_FULL_43_9]|nr:MAG: agmatinase [Deltaproteobacteria bacterium RIFCSPHIGHO2_12_FULL_43_9]